MCPKGSESRNANFQVLSFVRAGFAVVHLPLITTVLAATVPFWTMTKFDCHSVSQTATPQPVNQIDDMERSTRVTQLFYLADKSWSGLIGWIMTAIWLQGRWYLFDVDSACSNCGAQLRWLSTAFLIIRFKFDSVLGIG